MNYTKGLVEQFQFLILLTTSTILIPYIFCTASYLLMRLRVAGITKNIFTGAIVLAALTFLFCIWIILGLGYETGFWGFVLTMSSVPIYVYAIWKRDQKEAK